MSAQILELMIFAGIAFFIINKLIATLGSTSEEDKVRHKSEFQGMGSLKDVTNSVTKTGFKKNLAGINKSKLKELCAPGTEDEISKGLVDLLLKLPNFNPINFIKGAKQAFKMIIEANTDQNEEEIAELVDKRYMEHFMNMSANYGKYTAKNEVEARYSEIYTFGNNLFIKILFSGKDITDKIQDFHEEWTFTKSTLNSDNDWHLTNIDRPQ